LSCESENDIFIDIVEQIFRDCLFALLALGHFCNFLLLLCVLFLVVKHLLESEEVLPRLLVQLLVDVFVDGDEARYHHVLERVDTTISYLDFLVEGQERGLQ
jgi:hypothetical protein